VYKYECESIVVGELRTVSEDLRVRGCSHRITIPCRRSSKRKFRSGQTLRQWNVASTPAIAHQYSNSVSMNFCLVVSYVLVQEQKEDLSEIWTRFGTVDSAILATNYNITSRWRLDGDAKS
jgi:hypothetical protein